MKSYYLDVKILKSSCCHFVSHSIDKHYKGWSSWNKLNYNIIKMNYLGILHYFAWKVAQEFSAFILVQNQMVHALHWYTVALSYTFTLEAQTQMNESLRLSNKIHAVMCEGSQLSRSTTCTLLHSNWTHADIWNIFSHYQNTKTLLLTSETTSTCTWWLNMQDSSATFSRTVEAYDEGGKPHQGAPQLIFRYFMQSELLTGKFGGFVTSQSLHHNNEVTNKKLKKEVAWRKKKTLLFMDWIPLFPAMTSLRRSATWWNNFKYATICQRVETRIEHIRAISHFVNESEKHYLYGQM